MNTNRQTVSNLLQCARDLITDPKKWTTGAFARTSTGAEARPTDSAACSFCSLGAIEKCLQSRTDSWLYDEAIGVLHDFARGMSIGYFNDHSSHKRVLAAFDKAIAAVKQKENAE